MATEKLHKVLARCGLASRREIERWIAAGRVSVNGAIASVGQRVAAEDILQVDGKEVEFPEVSETQVLLYHKPVGEMCTRHDPEGRPTVFAALPPCPHGRWISVGRLDFNSSGVLLFTNDGDLAAKLMHPRNSFEREYKVRVMGELSNAELSRLQHGVHLPEGEVRVKQIICDGGKGFNQWYRLVVTEGRNRLVRRLFEELGHPVNRLMRLRYGTVSLPMGLKPGSYEILAKRLWQSMAN